MICGIDIGGTKTLIGLFDEHGKVISKTRFETPSEYNEFLVVLEKNIEAAGGGVQLESCVVAVPGKLDRQNGIGIAFGNLAWENVPIGRDISSMVGKRVAIENDAKLAGLSEALLVPRYRTVFYLTVSTGIGGGLIVDGKLDQDTIESEVGHMIVERDGRLMTWEELASGKTITKKFGKRAADIDDERDWYIISRNIAVGLINVIATMAPEAVIIGGGVGSHLPKFKDRLEEELRIYQSNVVNLPTLLQAQRPEEAVIYGCYEYARQLAH